MTIFTTGWAPQIWLSWFINHEITPSNYSSIYLIFSHFSWLGNGSRTSSNGGPVSCSFVITRGSSPCTACAAPCRLLPVSLFRPRANDLGHAEPRPAMAPQRRDTATRAKVDLNKRCSATINGVFHQKWGPYLSLVPRHHPAIERWLIFPFTSSPSSDKGVSTTIHHSSPL